MQSLRSELVYGEVDYVEAFSNGRQLPDSIVEQWCDCIDHIVGKPAIPATEIGEGRGWPVYLAIGATIQDAWKSPRDR